ncbi:MAG: YceD family protein [Ramlibacter sp.]
MSKEPAMRSLDVKRFAEDGRAVEGRTLLEQLPRLESETRDPAASLPIAWSATGELRNPGHLLPEIWMHLKADAGLVLTCQRCLGAIEVPVRVDRAFRFVGDEDSAAAQDEHAEEDVLALSRTFDLLGLVEDELLMELPLAPRHDICPVPVTLEVSDEGFDSAPDQRENPFAILGTLKPDGS